MRHFLFLSLCLTACQGAGGATYTVRDLGTLPGCFMSRGTDLNDHGQIVGWAEAPGSISKGFIWSDGRMTELAADGATETLATSINNHCQVVGCAILDGWRSSVTWSSNTVTVLGGIDKHPILGLPGNFIVGGAINDRGQIVWRTRSQDGRSVTAIRHGGQDIFPDTDETKMTIAGLALNDRNEIAGGYIRAGRSMQPFVWRDGRMIEISIPGRDKASATDISNTGLAIGWAAPSNKQTREAVAFVWRDGEAELLGTLGGKTSRAYGVNSQDQVVGYSAKADKSYAAFVWNPDSRTMTDLNGLIGSDSDWRLISAQAINNSGQILAHGLNDKKSRAVLLTPVGPEAPESSPAPPVPETGAITQNASAEIHFSSIERAASGEYRLILDADAGDDCAVEFSSDLKTWTRLENVTREPQRTVFIDPSAPETSIRFYRIVRKSVNDR